jgi:hypothetical protein
LKVRIHRLAVAEIDHEVDYYESCRVGLGAELEDEIEAVLETMLQFPKQHRSGEIGRTADSPCWIAFRSLFRIRSSAKRS